jgi:hypothetical protein
MDEEKQSFSAVSSAEQLICDLENPSKTSSTNDYLIASNVNSNALHGGQRPIQAQPTSCSFLTSHTTTSTNPGTRDPYSYSSCDWDFPVNFVDQKFCSGQYPYPHPRPSISFAGICPLLRRGIINEHIQTSAELRSLFCKCDAGNEILRLLHNEHSPK